MLTTLIGAASGDHWIVQVAQVATGIASLAAIWVAKDSIQQNKAH